ncbi:hypothetical protein KKC32_03995 [Patescibacteria group bacterium]|nr:hypothetical protein [Patescibacteria group bacterium]
MNIKKILAPNFFSLLGIFAIIAAYLAIPFSMELKQKLFPAIAVLAILFFLLGIALLVMTIKSKTKGKLKLFLIFTGASAIAFPVSVILHNVIYGLFIHFFGENFWGNGGDEPVFFILATMVCPIIFLIGAIGSSIIFFKQNKKFS